MNPLRTRLAAGLVWFSALMVAIEVGGGIFEHLVLDRAWPSNLALIQPERGGAHRAPFWMIVHGVLTVSLLATLWASWPHRALRKRVAWVLGLHVAMRIWSFVYFIPVALRFEQATSVNPDEVQTWVILSPLRTALTLVAFVLLFRPKDVPLH
ncbi:MAG TPA: hypothetical protein VNA24_37730 [Hyalangium sp.]|jgi:hypothetical protein|nr:hypothetical protein [Hyalangium sp.]